MKTSLKTGFAKIFSCCPQKMGDSKIWGSPPFAPLARTPLLTKANEALLTMQFDLIVV